MELVRMALPSTLEKIGMYAFYGCTALADVTFDGQVKHWEAMERGNYWCDGIPATTVFCRDGSTDIRS
jgi:hypothetical protein